MKKFDLGLSNHYLKLGVTLLLLSVLVVLFAIAFGGGVNVFRALVFLLATGMLLYAIGHIVKATSIPRK